MKSQSISLHKLVNQLMQGLQPLAMRRGNVILNGIPDGISFFAEEKVLSQKLWDVISRAVNGSKNECLHVITLIADDSTTVCVKNRAHGADASFSISNNFLTA
jgi:hypothetical protein